MDEGHIVRGCRDCSKGLSQAILSWFKEQLPKEKDEMFCHCNPGAEPAQYCGCGVKDYNQCLKDILTNLTAKQGER